MIQTYPIHILSHPEADKKKFHDKKTNEPKKKKSFSAKKFKTHGVIISFVY